MIIFKKWLASKELITENMLAWINSSVNRNKIRSYEKPKTTNFASNAEESSEAKNHKRPLKDGQTFSWTSEKFKSMKVYGRRDYKQKYGMRNYHHPRMTPCGQNHIDKSKI